MQFKAIQNDVCAYVVFVEELLSFKYNSLKFESYIV